MADFDPELEAKFTKLMLSSMLRTLDVLNPGIDVTETVHQNMLGICGGVRERALAAAGVDVSPEQATAHVDQLIAFSDEFFAYAVDGTGDLDYTSAFEYFGLQFKKEKKPEDAQEVGWLGASIDSGAAGQLPGEL